MKDVPGFEGILAVTKTGKLWRHERLIPYNSRNRYRKVIKKTFARVNGGWAEINRPGKRGYYFTTVRIEGKIKNIYIHTLVARTYIPNPLGLRTVNHKNAIKTDNRVSNLEWCTQGDNVRHALKMGLGHKLEVRYGEAVNTAILNADEVREIRKLRLEGWTLKAIGSRYGVSFRTVWDITTGRRWKHVV